MNQNMMRLTDADRRLLNGMAMGKTYGYNGGNHKPFHSIPGFAQGVHQERLDRLIDLGYLEGVKAYRAGGMEYFAGYVKVKDLDDALPNDVATRIKTGLPDSRILHHWKVGNTFMVVLADARMIHFVTVTGEFNDLTFDVKSEWINPPKM